MTDTTAKAAPKRGRGRPPGSPNKPKPRAAAPTGPKAPEGPATASPDDVAAQSVADRIAAAAVPPTPPNEGGRPTARQTATAGLAEQLATTYRAFGGIVSVTGGGLQLVARTKMIGVRAQLVGDAIVENADSCGLALARFADAHPDVKRWLTKASTGATLMLVVAAHAPILFAAFGAPPELGAMAADFMTDPDAALGKLFGDLDVENLLAGFAANFPGAAPSGAFTQPVVDTTATDVV